MTTSKPGLLLEGLHVAGFKSIESLALDLGRLNLLIGANGAGKSNFIQVFRLLASLADQRLQLFVGQAGGADNLLHFGQKTTSKVSVRVDADEASYACALVPTSDDALILEGEECGARGSASKGSASVYQGASRESFLLVEAATPHVAKMRAILTGLEPYHFHDTSDSARVRKPCDVADNKRLRPDASNLAAFLHLLQQRHPGEYRNVVDTIRLTAPFLDDFVLEPDRLRPDTIRLAWRHTQSDRYFGPHTLSDGTLRFACLAALLLQPDLPTTILMDEPELGLHPQAIGLLAELMKAAAVRTQIVVATQSVTMVNHFEPKDVVVVEQQGGGSLFRRLSDAETSAWLDDYGVGDLWEKNLLGGRP